MVETGNLRRRLERAIETMISALDALEDDADLEPDNDDEPSGDEEPWLGAIERHPSGERGWTPFLRRDDDGSQSVWGGGSTDDREFDDADDEDGGDLEECCEDEGAQCDDEYDDGIELDIPAPTPSKIRSALDPSLMPVQYFMTGEGDCLTPVVKNGDRVLISKAEPVRPGDLVAIYLNRKFVPRGEHQVLLKRLVVDGRAGDCKLPNRRPAAIVEMLNPPRQFAIPAEAILTIHRVVCVDNETPAPRLRPGAMLAGVAEARKAAAQAKGIAR